MEEFHKTMRRSSALVTTREVNETYKKLPRIFHRYPTRFSIHTYSEKHSLATPIYVPAPKPSKLLLDYLRSPCNSQLSENLSKIGELPCKKTKSGLLQAGNKTPNLIHSKTSQKFPGDGIGRRIKISC